MPREQEKRPAASWQEIAQQITTEQNPKKVIELARKLNQAMLEEQREKTRDRLRTSG